MSDVVKAWRVDGAFLRAARPMATPVRDPGMLPEPVPGALIAINDRLDGDTRVRWASGNGASWDRVAFLSDLPAAGTTVDLAPVLARVAALESRAAQPAKAAELQVSGFAGPAAVDLEPIHKRLAKLEADHRDLAAAMLAMAARLDALEGVEVVHSVAGAT